MSARPNTFACPACQRETRRGMRIDNLLFLRCVCGFSWTEVLDKARERTPKPGAWR